MRFPYSSVSIPGINSEISNIWVKKSSLTKPESVNTLRISCKDWIMDPAITIGILMSEFMDISETIESSKPTVSFRTPLVPNSTP